MAAWTLAEIRTRLIRKFQNHSGIADSIDDAVVQAQLELEEDPKLRPRFLVYDSDVESTNKSTVADQATIDNWTNFIIEYEKGGLYRYDTEVTGNWKELIKDDFNSLVNKYTDPGKPLYYSVVGAKVRFFPTPDAVYTIRGVFLGHDDQLADDSDTNLWSLHAPLLLMNKAGLIVAQELQYLGHVSQFQTMVDIHYANLWRKTIAEEEANQESQMGDN